MIERASPNHDARAARVTMIVLHYSGTLDAAAALDRLGDPAAKVSAHYFIDEAGTTYALVPEDRRAWHAGEARWRGIEDIDSASIGIELANPGHALGYCAFPDAQIEALIPLMADIKDRHGITRGNIVGHSDVAPTRRQDPGELFAWHRLARLRLALPRPTKHLVLPPWSEAGFLLALERFGYDVTDPFAAVVAFQRRFRPELIDGEVDGECKSLLLALLLPKPEGDA